jgi:hypothetical protein
MEVIQNSRGGATPGGPRANHPHERRITVRGLVILAVSGALTALTWSRTGGDGYLAALIGILAIGALDLRVAR